MLQLILSSWIARTVGLALLGLVAIKGYALYEQRKGEEIVYQRSEAEGKKLSNESTEAINSVNTDDKLFNKLFLKYCRDCKR